MENLTDNELLDLANNRELFDEKLNEEWVRRYGINFPYRLTYRKEILNCLSLKVMKDEDCDKLIVRQANKVRGRDYKFY